MANALVQKGFEHLTASAITGSFGIDVTGTSKANTIIGTDNNDNITPGLGADTITAGKGSDFIDVTESTSSGDVINFIGYATNGVDEISGFNVAADKIVFTAMGVGELAAGTGENSQTQALTKSNAKYDVGSSAGDTLAANGAVYVDNTSDLSGVTDAAVYDSLKEGGSTLVVADEDSFYYVADDGTDTFIFHIHAEGATINDSNDLVDHVATLRGISAAEDLTKANFGTDTGLAIT